LVRRLLHALLQWLMLLHGWLHWLLHGLLHWLLHGLLHWLLHSLETVRLLHLWC